MPVIAIKTHCGEDDNLNFDWALVEVTPKLLEVLTRRREMLMQAMALDPQLLSMSFVDYTPEFHSEADLDIWGEDNEPPKDSSGWKFVAEMEDGSSVLHLPDGIEIEDRGREFQTDLDLLIVYQDGFVWEVCPKHTDLVITTDRRPLSDFEEVLPKVAEVS